MTGIKFKVVPLAPVVRSAGSLVRSDRRDVTERGGTTLIADGSVRPLVLLAEERLPDYADVLLL